MTWVASEDPVVPEAWVALVDPAAWVASADPATWVASEDPLPLEVSAYLPVVLEISVDPGASVMAVAIPEQVSSEALAEAVLGLVLVIATATEISRVAAATGLAVWLVSVYP